jgi:hypothetical protein
MRDNNKVACMLIGVAISGDRNVMKKNQRRLENIKTLQQIHRAFKCKKSDAGNNRGKLNHVKISQKIPQQHTGKAHQQSTENSHNGHCTHRPTS